VATLRMANSLDLGRNPERYEEVMEIGSKNMPLRSPASAVDLVHLRYAVAAADHGSFRRAAEALLLRQSTLSRCIRQLEARTKMIVFERSSGGVQATPAGRDFLQMARSILEQMDALVLAAHSTGYGRAGRLTIGFFTSLSAGNLRAALVEFRQRFPQIELSWPRGHERALLPRSAMAE
jgi:DNA-binding transcriptional LysR family regulator